MATYMNVGRVEYETPSTVVAPLCRLYFCRHCLKLRSSECVSHEVDSHYCPNCLENMPSAEAKVRKNRCASCFDCPSCGHTLSTRATSLAVTTAEEAKPVPKKVYYLACGFCRWTSRDVGIPDQLVSTGGWPDKLNPHIKQIEGVLDYYRALAAKEKNEKEKRRFTRKRNYFSSLAGSFDDPLGDDKYGLNPATIRRRSVLSSIGGLSLKEADEKLAEAPKPETVAEVEGLDHDIFSKPLQLESVTGVRQRHASPEQQPMTSEHLFPIHKHMLIKRSLRCRECEHNLSKPEFNPSSIKFKIQLVAMHHVPEVRILKQPNLYCNQETQVVLTLFNPLGSITHVTLHAAVEPDEWSNAKVVLPTSELLLLPRDDSTEFGDSNNVDELEDDPKIIVFRKANKIGFFVRVTPLSSEGDVKVRFSLRYDYRNLAAVIPTEDTEAEVIWLSQTVRLNLGALSESLA